MRHIILFLNASFLLAACGGTPTPSEFDLYIATREAEMEARERYFSCTTEIEDQVELLEQDSDACSNDYDCKAMISQQIEELADRLKSTCAPIQPELASNFDCKIRLIQAKADLAHGAPNETGANRALAEEYLADQVKEAYEFCFSLVPEAPTDE